MQQLRAWLTDENASQFPFTFKVGDRVRFVRKPELTGTVEEGIFAGDWPDGGHTIRFYIVSDKDGTQWEAEPGEIEIISEKI